VIPREPVHKVVWGLTGVNFLIVTAVNFVESCYPIAGTTVRTENDPEKALLIYS